MICLMISRGGFVITRTRSVAERYLELLDDTSHQRVKTSANSRAVSNGSPTSSTRTRRGRALVTLPTPETEPAQSSLLTLDDNTPRADAS